MYEFTKVVTSLDIQIFKCISRFHNVRLETMVSTLFKSIVMTFLVRECYGSPKISIKFVKIRQNSLKFTPEECYDKVLNEEF
jgi:hypothetical protein